MFLDLHKLKERHHLNIRGIIHIGAHLLEEKQIYNELQISNVVWIEANEDLVNTTQKWFPEEIILNYVVYDVDDQEMTFNIASNGQSSSLLEFGTHALLYPHIAICEQKLVKTKSLKTIIQQHNINMASINMLNLDIQGVELRAIRGLEDYISSIDYIYVEVNDDEVYINNDLIQDLDAFLEKNGFFRAETYIVGGNWGDALYIKSILTT